MRELSQPQRDRLPDSAFAYIDRDGERHLPIDDADHVRNAIARFDQTDFQSRTAKEEARKRILASTERDDIEVSDDSDVAHPVHRAHGSDVGQSAPVSARRGLSTRSVVSNGSGKPASRIRSRNPVSRYA
jgi:Family of unknown function (DUF6582)